MKTNQLEQRISELEKEINVLDKSLGKLSSKLNDSERDLLNKTSNELNKKYGINEKSYEKLKYQQKADFLAENLKDIPSEEAALIVSGLYTFSHYNWCCPDDDKVTAPTLWEKLNITKYAEKGENGAGLDEKKILSDVFEKNSTKEYEQFRKLSEEINQTKNKRKELGKLCGDIEGTLKCYNLLIEGKQDPEKIEKEMPDFIKQIKNGGSDGGKQNVIYATADPKQNVGVMLIDGWEYYGSGGSEYGVTVKILRDGNEVEEYFKYRDPYSAEKDDKSLSFECAKIMKITKDSVKLELTPRDKKTYGSTIKTFSIKQDKAGRNLETLTEKDQKQFKKMYSQTKEELLEKSYFSTATMPDYINFTFFTGTLPQGATTGKRVPYDKPEVVSEYVDEKTGIGALVIKSQIDFQAGEGKQFAWRGYVINSKGKTTEKYYDCAYELQLKNGKRMDIKAKDLFKSGGKK